MNDLAEVLGAAGRALLPRLGPVAMRGGERLAGSDRNVVLRAVARDGGGRDHRVVVKVTGSVREEAALAVLAGHGVPGVARLLAAAAEPPLVVLEDLGDPPSLADRLLGDDPDAAERALLAWAGALGTLHARTAGLREPFARGLAAFGRDGGPPPAVDTAAETLAKTAEVLDQLLPYLSVTAPPGAWEELRGIADELDVSAPGRPGALTPGDACTDNAVLTDDGGTDKIVLLDFEWAEYRHVAWDVAYLLVPWPSCWCAFDLPPTLAERGIAAWRDASGLPADERDLDRARTAWTFLSFGWMLRTALEGDPPLRRGTAPTRRMILQHRLAWAAEHAPYDRLGALAATTLQATRRVWGTTHLPLAPAFR